MQKSNNAIYHMDLTNVSFSLSMKQKLWGEKVFRKSYYWNKSNKYIGDI